MPRRLLIRNQYLPYHLYGRANNKDWFYLPMPEVWEIFVHFLHKANMQRGFVLHVFVLMSNHYHMLATASGDGVDRVMARLLKSISDEINRRANRCNHVFGGPYKWTLIENWFHYHHAFRYVYQNPVRAGICKHPDEYRFSSLHNLQFGKAELPLVSHEFERQSYKYISHIGHKDWISWLREPYDKDHVDGMRRALSRRRFAFCEDRRTRKIAPLFKNAEVSLTK